MNKTIPDALAFTGAFVPEMLELTKDAGWPEVVVCPPFTAIAALSAALSGYKVGVGAQDVHWLEKGALTGEVAPSMLKDAGCAYVIIGHSERRQLMGETDEMVQKKVRAALSAGLRPIVCVGETLVQREQGRAFDVVESMTREAFSGVAAGELPDAVIAYEPVWAIGTGKEAKPADASEMITRIRGAVDATCGQGAGETVRILYGGSVKPGNIRSFMAQDEIDGALVGGASLDPLEFAKMLFEILKGRPKP